MITSSDELSKNLIKQLKTNSSSHTLNSKNSNNSDSKKKSKESNNALSNLFDKTPLPKKKDIKYLEENIYKEKQDDRRNLLKEQCAIDIIVYKDKMLKSLTKNEKNNEVKPKY